MQKVSKVYREAGSAQAVEALREVTFHVAPGEFMAVTGGSGSVFGTFLGVLLIALLQVGLPFVGLNADWQLLITGCILLGAVTIDKMRNS